MRKFRILLSILFVFTISLSVKAQETNSNLDSLDAYFLRSMQDWSVPGMAIGIIKGDSVIFAKGYGLRNMKKKDAVDIQTVFPIASNTKAFTAAALAILVDADKLSWDTKVVEILPYFQMYDDYVTAHFTIADMLSHRSGLKTFSGDLLWYGSDYSREDIVKKLPLLKPKYDFRTSFGYSNIMYIAASEVIEKVSGQSYNEFIKSHFFEPLGMKNSYLSISELEELENVCTPHNKINDDVFPIELMNWDNIGGAGNINSNVEDMTKWLQLQLNRGQWNDSSIFSMAQSVEMWTSYTNFKVSPGYQRRWPSTHFRSYGLGWSLKDYHHKLIVSHSGGYDGVITYTCLVPEENLGFVILTNSNSSLYNALSYRILDHFLSQDTIDWSSLYLPFQQKGDKRKVIVAKEDAEKPSLKLKNYEGLYKSELYGNALITVKGKKMKVQLLRTKMWEGTITTYAADTFLLEFKNVPALPQGFIRFALDDKKENISSFVIDVPNPDFDFTEFEFIKMDWIEIPKEETK